MSHDRITAMHRLVLEGPVIVGGPAVHPRLAGVRVPDALRCLVSQFTCQGRPPIVAPNGCCLASGPQMWVPYSERVVMSEYSSASCRWLCVPLVLAASATVGVYFAGPALAAPGQVAAEPSGFVAGTPCTATAAACVDVENKRAWLIKDGKIARGPVVISTGGTGTDTPTGDSFRVFRKDKDHTSNEFKLPNGQPAPMPNSVFFEDGGIAFHAGSPQRASAGCVHLGLTDSVAFYNFLNIGDQVQVMNGPVAASDATSPAVADASALKDDSNDPDAHSSAPEVPDDDDASHLNGGRHGD